ncbi:putative Cytochrome bd2, subunit II [Cronobacter condimenti 1330]|uniref:Cytochrome D oxidase subunit II n=1 Tax=Cronobacter condimenti 1330 TaxID=1073999 RepID=K8AJC3_9ENTR|nr:cytochrome d ubiquinol oxidase subunit II [Cronobacter condimenti]ALB64708.1 cytochrome D oxidase subunit II [Cronobacter condimenti 1330]CCJ74377.1 putative Cytochrome bd2, subunit II [Cronobacter condimenti 1330]
MIDVILSLPLFTLLCAAALALGVLVYVLLDGADLGVGLLAPFQSPQARQQMNISLLPVWDGNETWLVLTAGALLAMFPVAFSILYSALYLPVWLMLLALIVRGMAIEYRHLRPALFDALFIGGSWLAALTQGATMGAWIEGIRHDGTQFTGGPMDWLSPFSVYCAIALSAGYALLGAGWLIWRCEGELSAWARRQAMWLAPFTAALLAGLLVWTVQLNESYRLHLQLWAWSGPLVAMGLLAFAGLGFALRKRRDFLPIAMTLLLFIAAFGAMLLAVFPFILPPNLLLTQAAAPPATQKLMLAAFGIFVPITLIYNSWGFWIFRGKIHAAREDDRP